MIEERLIEKYFKNNELNMKKVVDDYYNYIGTIIKNFQNVSQEDEEEIISDVFFIIWKNKEKLDRTLEFSPYIAGITKKVIYKKYNQNRVSKLIYEDFEDDIIDNFNIENLLEEKEINDCILRNLKSLGEKEYLVFTKFYYEDKKVKDIAKDLEMSVSSVKTTLHRTRKKVKEFLKIGGFC
ncbi:MAG: sigma-70 family RNA polymerase sigma factor [Clostridia bacterium]|nr:sigma-70 family RNA polymerase sigma factor [Clostridia bacterium]